MLWLIASTRAGDWRRAARILAAAVLSLAAAAAAAAGGQDIVAQADATVASGAATANRGLAGTLAVRSADPRDARGNERIWLRFDLRGRLPPGARVTAARLRLHVADSGAGAPLAVAVHAGGDDWEESRISWRDQPALGPRLASTTLTQAQAGGWIELDVTAFVQYRSRAAGVMSFVVRPLAEGAAQPLAYRFGAREGTALGYSRAPLLRLRYAGEAPADNGITVLHTNALHAGGAAGIAAALADLKASWPDALVVDTGGAAEDSVLGGGRGNSGAIDALQRLDVALESLPANASGRGIDAALVGARALGTPAMLENLQDPDGDGVVNGWFDIDGDGTVDGFNPPGTDAEDLPYLAVNVVREGAPPAVPGPWPRSLPFRPYLVVPVAGARVAILGYLAAGVARPGPETARRIDVLEAAWADKGNGAAAARTVLLEEWVAHLRRPRAAGGAGADVVLLLTDAAHWRLSADGDAGRGAGSDELLADRGAVAPPELVIAARRPADGTAAWQPSTLNARSSLVAGAAAGAVGEVRLSAGGRYLDASQHEAEHRGPSPLHPGAGGGRASAFVAQLVEALEAEHRASSPAGDCTGHAEPRPLRPGPPCRLDEVIGYLEREPGRRAGERRRWEQSAPARVADPTASLVADAMLAWAHRPGGAARGEAQLAVHACGATGRAISAGAITYRDVLEAGCGDDAVLRVRMSSRELWGYLQSQLVGTDGPVSAAAISSGWQVRVEDGRIRSIGFDADADGRAETALAAADTATTWQVLLGESLYRSGEWLSSLEGRRARFRDIDPSPAYLAAEGAGRAAEAGRLRIREALRVYLSRFQAGNPLALPASRYRLNTSIAGEFEAVVTMSADAEAQPYFEGVFVRLLRARPETLIRRRRAAAAGGLAALVAVDGSIEPGHEFRETMLYRGHLGFRDGALQPGDRLLVRGEFGFAGGNPHFIAQAPPAATGFAPPGFAPAPALARPTPVRAFADFFREGMENHLVQLYAVRAGTDTVEDRAGRVLPVYRAGGRRRAGALLPGGPGDCLALIGVQTEHGGGERRFRLREAQRVPSGEHACAAAGERRLPAPPRP